MHIHFCAFLPSALIWSNSWGGGVLFVFFQSVLYFIFFTLTSLGVVLPTAHISFLLFPRLQWTISIRIIISSMIICGLYLMILSFVNHQFYPKQPVTCFGQLSVFALLSFYIWFCSIPGSTTVRTRSIKWLSRPWPDNTHCGPENRKQPAYTGNRVPGTEDFRPKPWVHPKMSLNVICFVFFVVLFFVF